MPQELQGITSGDEFLEKLPAFDGYYDELRRSAQKEKSVLRYVGVIDVKEGVIKAALEKLVLFLSALELFLSNGSSDTQKHIRLQHLSEVQTTLSCSTLSDTVLARSSSKVLEREPLSLLWES